MKFIPKNLRSPIIDKSDPYFKIFSYLQVISLVGVIGMLDFNNEEEIIELQEKTNVGIVKLLEDSTESVEDKFSSSIEKSLNMIEEESKEKLTKAFEKANQEKIQVLRVLNQNPEFIRLKKQIQELPPNTELENATHLDLLNKILEIKGEAHAKVANENFQEKKKLFEEFKQNILSEVLKKDSFEDQIKELVRQISSSYPYQLSQTDIYQLKGNCESSRNLYEVLVRTIIEHNKEKLEESPAVGSIVSISNGEGHITATISHNNKHQKLELNHIAETKNSEGIIKGTNLLKALIGIPPENRNGIQEEPAEKGGSNSLSNFGLPSEKTGENTAKDPIQQAALLEVKKKPEISNTVFTQNIEEFNNLPIKIQEHIRNLSKRIPDRDNYTKHLKKILSSITKLDRGNMETNEDNYFESEIIQFQAAFLARTNNEKIAVTTSSTTTAKQIEQSPNVSIHLSKPHRLISGRTYNLKNYIGKILESPEVSSTSSESIEELEDWSFEEHTILDLSGMKTAKAFELVLEILPEDKTIFVNHYNESFNHKKNIVCLNELEEFKYNNSIEMKLALDLRNSTDNLELENDPNFNIDENQNMIVISNNTNQKNIDYIKETYPNIAIIKLD